MSLIKAIKQQLGLSATPANNFTFDASANNGTMKLARGNAGATTQDILTVAANGGIAVRGLLAAPATGFVGEVVAFTNSPTSVSTGAYNGIGYVNPLSAGTWLLIGTMDYDITTGPCQMRSAGFSTSNGSFTNGNVLEQYSSTGGFVGSVALVPTVMTLASATTIYVTGRASFTGGSITMSCNAYAVRIA